MRRRVTVVGLAVVLALLGLPAAVLDGQQGQTGGQDQAAGPRSVYIVSLGEAPVTAYQGGIPGYAATRPARGAKADQEDPDVVRYSDHLRDRHDQALSAVGGGRKLYSYRQVFNGFAAELTEVQAAKMANVPGVVGVVKDQLRTADTSSTPTFLGLTARGGLWNQLGGADDAGEDIIIGVIDSGIWPESLSFADRRSGSGRGGRGGDQAYDKIKGWHGQCTPGEAFNASLCNRKLIGAQFYNAAWGGDAGIDALRPWEFNSPRDYNGHGTHTSSTAGGNNGVPATGPAAAFGAISGIAPRARISSYKALWSTIDGSQASGFSSDLVAAIDQAVADGVDVINYSISGTRTDFLDPEEIAFLYAADAGVFVAVSAGNDGPAASTVAHPSPWLTTVAAGTHNRSGVGAVTFGDGATHTGPSLAQAAVTAPLIDAAAAGLAGADPEAVRLCFSAVSNGGVDALDPAKVTGKIVVCDRGSNARVDKSFAVMQAGGVGMILVNTGPNSLNADLHSVPTVHLADTAYAAVHAYAATTGPTATIDAARIDFSTPAPFTAAFSSRGPLLASVDLLKPDLIAPGVDILAAVAPPANFGLDFSILSGTSMSSPHVAGLAALLKQLHPGWSPMMIKSALMTTGADVLDGPNTDPAVIFSQGAGHVRPNRAADPGLVFDSDWTDWVGFLCGTQLNPSYCDANDVPVLDPSDFNGPSIAIGALLTNTQTITRRVTNVGERSTYRVALTGLAGFTVSVSPASFTLRRGETRTIRVTITRNGAVLNAYSGGYLTWRDGRHSVRIPVVVRPIPMVAPVEVTGSYTVNFGYDGPFSAAPRGLVPAATFTGSLFTGDYSLYDVDVPAGTTYARFSLSDDAVTPGSDLDLYVFRGNTLVGSSFNAGSTEEVSLEDPAAGIYTVLVDGYATANPSTFTLFTWVLGSAGAGNMSVSAPASATTGATGTITLSFSGLGPGTKYLGSVVYGGVSGLPRPTIVRIDQ